MRYRLAATLLFASPCIALAQGNVTMYGLVDGGIAYVKTDSAITGAQPGARTGGAFRVDSTIQSPTQFGIRGVEDLGGGTSAFFDMQGAFFVDDGTGGSPSNGLDFQRRTIVGLQGRWGQLFVGRDLTPGFYAFMFGNISAAAFFGNALSFQSGPSGGIAFQQARYSNAIFYNTPTWNGLRFRSAFGNAAASGSEYSQSPKSRDRNFEIAAYYNQGPVKASAYFRTGYLDAATDPSPAVQPDLAKIRQYGAAAAYDFGRVRVAAGVSVHDPDTPRLITDRIRLLQIGTGVRVGAGELMVGAWRVWWTDIGAGQPLTTGSLVAYTYPLSKRTNLYATYGRMWQNHGANLNLWSAGPYAPPTGSTSVNSAPSGVGMGIRHFF